MAAAPKRSAKDKREAEKVTPKTPKQEAEEYMAEMLKSAASARGAHIKLTNVPYGKDLAKELLQFAEATESLYKQLQGALDGDTKTLVHLLGQAKQKEEEGSKAKAWLLVYAWV